MRIPKEYIGKYVVIVNRKIIASGKTHLDAYNKAKEKVNSEAMLSFMYVPTKNETVTFL